ncbi:endonuclease [Mesorhizobium sp. CU2]|uniref:endonuclease n=1 Tax=unclassified Mesorhizobium TaxID=325217 RepID=UPI001127F5C3|nr:MULTISPECIES: endonuclease [unclassified Mesorhizobium]TPN82575.1 endonuclease [Mesorhizobium sp. CU3]TPO12779.1 endonuclease [Mesorhizobium sp. CU2]
MRKVDRSAVGEPPDLHSRRPSDGKTELELVTQHMNGPRRHEAFDFTRYKQASVKTALEQLFHGKCAYCESFYGATQPVDVEHFRPKGEVENADAHPGYWWLAMEWTNLLPSCIDCNRRRKQKTPSPRGNGKATLLDSGEFDRSKSLNTGKECAFPLIGGVVRAMKPSDDLSAERRLLIDPTIDDPDAHLAFHVDRAHLVSLVYPRPLSPGEALALPEAMADPEGLATAAKAANVSPMGMVSIQIYGLNRLGLVQNRTKVLRDMEFLLELSLDLEEIAVELDDRINARSLKLSQRPRAKDAELANDLRADRRILAKIRQFTGEIRSQLRARTNASSPYSRLARAWVEAYVAS